MVVYPCSECGVIGYPGSLYDNVKVSFPLLVPYPNFFYYLPHSMHNLYNGVAAVMIGPQLQKC